jgi:predicted O-methyltransferase YrrM
MSLAKDYTIVKGSFNDTLPKANTGPIALLRMDADWYDSTKQILAMLASSVATGGLVIVDDYYTWAGCARAVNEYAAEKSWPIRQFRRGGICYMQPGRG